MASRLGPKPSPEASPNSTINTSTTSSTMEWGEGVTPRQKRRYRKEKLEYLTGARSKRPTPPGGSRHRDWEGEVPRTPQTQSRPPPKTPGGVPSAVTPRASEPTSSHAEEMPEPPGTLATEGATPRRPPRERKPPGWLDPDIFQLNLLNTTDQEAATEMGDLALTYDDLDLELELDEEALLGEED